MATVSFLCSFLSWWAIWGKLVSLPVSLAPSVGLLMPIPIFHLRSYFSTIVLNHPSTHLGSNLIAFTNLHDIFHPFLYHIPPYGKSWRQWVVALVDSPLLPTDLHHGQQSGPRHASYSLHTRNTTHHLPQRLMLPTPKMLQISKLSCKTTNPALYLS